MLKNLPDSTHEDAVYMWKGFCEAVRSEGKDIADVPAARLEVPWVWETLKWRLRKL